MTGKRRRASRFEDTRERPWTLFRGVSCIFLLPMVITHASSAGATLLLSDGFGGATLDTTKWHLPAWTPDGATFLGRTQLRVSQTLPLPLPQLANGTVRLPLSTHNPTALVPGDSFYGAELISNATLQIGNGLAIEVRARIAAPARRGVVGGIFGYSVPAGGLHDEVDFELIGTMPNHVQTQVYAAEPLGTGHPAFHALPNGSSISDFHTYRLEILPDRVSWYVDGTLVRSDTTHVLRGSLQFYLNIWAPAPEWAEAFDAGLQPVASAAANVDYFMEVDSVVISSVESPISKNYQGMWWAAPAGFESGWGINFAHQGDVIFATWFTHDLNRNAWNLSMTAFQTGPNTFSGALTLASGPPLGSVPFDSTQVQRTTVGSATLTFADGNNGTFAYTVNGVSQTKPIIRQVFRTPGTACHCTA